jgi:hypothetical protein
VLAHALDRSVLQAVAHNAETLALTLIFGLICIYLFRCAALRSVEIKSNQGHFLVHVDFLDFILSCFHSILCLILSMVGSPSLFDARF